MATVPLHNMSIVQAVFLVAASFLICGKAQDYPTDHIPAVYLNGSDHVTLNDPFHTPNGLFNNGSGNWTWTLRTYTQTYGALGGRVGSTIAGIWQGLYLSIDPAPAGTSQSEYLGCGAVIHGISYEKTVEGQKTLASDCKGFISDECRQALLDLADIHASGQRLARREDLKSDKDQECAALADNVPYIRRCQNDSSGHLWFEPFFIASIEKVPEIPSNGSDYRFVISNYENSSTSDELFIHAWDNTQYNTNDPTTYNNLTTLIEPILTMFTEKKQPTDDKAPTPKKNSNIMCLRTGKHLPEGAVIPEVPRPSLAVTLQMSHTSLLPAIAVGTIAFLF